MFRDRDAARREGALTANRLRELSANPIEGNFDRAHLQQIHAYVFQDLPQHRPGKLRGDSDAFYKIRELEEESIRYRVDYATKNVSYRIEKILQDLNGPAAFSGKSIDVAASRMARLYGDLDYAHGFYEGNSRTLREFTRTLVLKAGYDLDWQTSNVSPEKRNHLYIARDILVLERAHPGLAAMREDQTPHGPIEQNALDTLISHGSTGLTLENLIKENLAPARARNSIEHLVHESDSLQARSARLTKQLIKDIRKRANRSRGIAGDRADED